MIAKRIKISVFQDLIAKTKLAAASCRVFGEGE
jgi:hypothetical protein